MHIAFTTSTVFAIFCIWIYIVVIAVTLKWGFHPMQRPKRTQRTQPDERKQCKKRSERNSRKKL